MRDAVRASTRDLNGSINCDRDKNLRIHKYVFFSSVQTSRRDHNRNKHWNTENMCVITLLHVIFLNKIEK